MTVLRARAPGKVNLCLFVGEPREDGLHPLVSIVQALSLADELTLEPAAGDADEVVCPGVEGPNLAARALALYREGRGWAGAPRPPPRRCGSPPTPGAAPLRPSLRPASAPTSRACCAPGAC